ncbi:Sec-independent protein translocase protein TatB [Pontivivens insulae]|uniref:Sec-independent protein translocase protein TatB n=1 Tax=Pontivivens insulae TaxID=1639689 RepID=A0A2R8A9L5_9RHOB|nr:Sec-independent protein translocase protein TatB [Pontivivens insulae]RED12850.1 sec-independent protein translocase protein TatB [Pontivivens insulae]SPF28941.1 Sec-independent protein translocase protein TatB [Pontivivens insulae]
MFDIGFWEMAIVGIVALIVVGPNDLPKMFRAVGKYVGQAKGMARQFQNAMNQAARDSELSEVKASLDGVKTGLKTATDPLGQATKSARNYAKTVMEDFDPMSEEASQKRAETVQAEQAAAAQRAAAQAEVPHFEDSAEPAAAEASPDRKD